MTAERILAVSFKFFIDMWLFRRIISGFLDIVESRALIGHFPFAVFFDEFNFDAVRIAFGADFGKCRIALNLLVADFAKLGRNFVGAEKLDQCFNSVRFHIGFKTF